MIKNSKISENYLWYNEPSFTIQNDRLHIITSPDTDFWQRTHYGFQRDNGHCLLTKVNRDFALTVRTEFYHKNQYDQCGLMIRIDAENWIKASVEYETETHSRLGSVVTNLGYSDWSTIDINSKINCMWYRIQSKQNDLQNQRHSSLFTPLILIILLSLAGLLLPFRKFFPGKEKPASVLTKK